MEPQRDLMIGMDGDDVQELQRLLGMSREYQSGYFGLLTAKAVRNFQYDNGLAVDGIVGAQTWKKLRE